MTEVLREERCQGEFIVEKERVRERATLKRVMVDVFLAVDLRSLPD